MNSFFQITDYVLKNDKMHELSDLVENPYYYNYLRSIFKSLGIKKVGAHPLFNIEVFKHNITITNLVHLDFTIPNEFIPDVNSNIVFSKNKLISSDKQIKLLEIICPFSHKTLTFRIPIQKIELYATPHHKIVRNQLINKETILSHHFMKILACRYNIHNCNSMTELYPILLKMWIKAGQTRKDIAA